MAPDYAVVLKPGKEKPFLHGHHWIFSGAVHSMPSFEDGDLIPVYSSSGHHLGSAYFNKKSNIIGRMLAFDGTPPLEALKHRLNQALDLRKTFFSPDLTNGFRLINGEGDGIPGLVVDCYDSLAVVQCTTLGVERLKPLIVDYLREKLQPRTIFEKSHVASRKEEGLPPAQGVLFGEDLDLWHFKENGFIFTLDLKKSQKTGFFLDQREMRAWVKELSLGKRVFNGFSYTGGFSVYAAAGGASLVDSADIAADAVAATERHLALNGLQNIPHRSFCEDLFTFLRTAHLSYDLVILDPPAFAKKRSDLVQACRGYKDINRLAMQKMPPASLLLTSSCSHYVDQELFQKVLFQAACEAKRQVRVIGRHRLAPDHPLNLFHPEGEYLKSCLLYIE